MEEYASVLYHEQRAKSLDKSVESFQEKSYKSTKRNAINPNGTLSFNSDRSLRQSKTLDPLCRDASEQYHRFDGVHSNSLNGIQSPAVNDSNDAAASSYNDVFGGPPKYSFSRSNSQPSIPMTMYDEIFRLPPKVLSSSRLSNLPVFDPPSYDNAGVYGIAPYIRESAAALRYEDIFGGGLPTGPTHVGIDDLLERFETRSISTSRSSPRLQSTFKAAGCFQQNVHNQESPQNESFRRHRTPLRLQSFNSFLREKDEKMQQPADIKTEHKGSRLSSTLSWNEANVHFRPASSREKTPKNGVIQSNFRGKFQQQSFEAPDALFTQMPNSTLDKDTSSTNTQYPIKDGYEANDGRSKLKESTNQKHVAAALRTVSSSPQADKNKHYCEDIMKSSKARLNELQETWFTVDELKLKTNPTASPPPARLPPLLLHPRPASVAARLSGLCMANRVSEALCDEQTGSFSGDDQLASSCELDSAIHASISAIHLQQQQNHQQQQQQQQQHLSNIFLDTKEHAKLAEVARENDEEYASVDTSVSSSGEEAINNFNVVSPDKVSSGSMQQAEENWMGPFKWRQRQQPWQDIGVVQEAKEQSEKTTNWGEESREDLAKDRHRDKEGGKDGNLSEWDRATVKVKTKSPESAEEENQAKGTKDFLKLIETKAPAEILSKDDYKEGKKDTYWMEKANRIQKLEQRAAVVALETREREVREEREREKIRRERELERQREREKDRMDLERAAKERAVVEEAQAKLERVASDVREKAEWPAAEVKLRPTSNRAAAEKIVAEAHSRAAAKRVAKERTQVEVHGNNTRKITVERSASDVGGMGETAAAGNLASSGGHSQRNTTNESEIFHKTNVRTDSAQRRRYGMPDFVSKRESTNEVVMTGRSSGSNYMTTTNNSSHFSASKFPEVDGETAARRHSRLERHQRTLERAAKALAEKNQRDLEAQQEQAERHRVAGMLDAEIKRWSAGKQGNLRALLSTLQFILWRECGWQPFSLTDLINPAAVKKAYRKATLCVHPDKVQQKGASVQQKYTAEKVFDLLKEAWNKFSLEEQC